MENLAPAGNREALERADVAGADAEEHKVLARCPAVLNGQALAHALGNDIKICIHVFKFLTKQARTRSISATPHSAPGPARETSTGRGWRMPCGMHTHGICACT